MADNQTTEDDKPLPAFLRGHDKTTKGASSGDASPDAWMQGRISAERGERRQAPLWFLPSDQTEWLAGFDSLPAVDQP